MKKNKMMRFTSVLLIAVILTTCAISGTFAKYTTSQTVSDKVRVAYWGFNKENSVTINLFKSSYDDTNNGTTVKGESSAKVFAPGTENSASFNFKYANITGSTAPEVAYKFTVDATKTGSATTAQKLDENPNFYWTLQAPGDSTEKKYATMDNLIAAIKKTSGDQSGTKDYKPGNLPSGFNSSDNTYTIGWKWVFEGNSTIEDLTKNNATIVSSDTQDVYDTAMGNATELENVDITITITATQID